MKKKILIIGGASILSNYLISDLKENFEVYLLFNKRKKIISKTKKIDLDFNKKKDLNKISYLKFFLIINCAAITDVDYCEKNYLKCLNSNFFLVKKIVDEIKNTKTKFVQISTDQLFISKNKFIKEIEPPKPLNNYAKSKFLAEKYITNNLKKFFIIRTNFFGWGLNYKKTFSDNIIINLQKKRKIKVLTDVNFNPILLNDLSKIIKKMIKTDHYGIFNVCSNEKLSKIDLAKKIANKFNLTKKLIIPIKRSISKTKRPKNMVLSNNKLKRKFKIRINSIDNQIDLMFKTKKLNLIN